MRAEHVLGQIALSLLLVQLVVHFSCFVLGFGNLRDGLLWLLLSALHLVVHLGVRLVVNLGVVVLRSVCLGYSVYLIYLSTDWVSWSLLRFLCLWFCCWSSGRSLDNGLWSSRGLRSELLWNSCGKMRWHYCWNLNWGWNSINELVLHLHGLRNTIRLRDSRRIVRKWWYRHSLDWHSWLRHWVWRYLTWHSKLVSKLLDHILS